MSDRQSTDADRALRAFLRAVAFAEPLQLEVLRKYGIRLAGMRALRVLRDLGTVPISRFAEVLEIPRSTATGVIDRFEERGLVERTFDPSDRRVINVRVTPKGRAALEDQAPFDASVLGDRIRALSVSEQRQLAAILERIVDDDALDAVAARTSGEPDSQASA